MDFCYIALKMYKELYTFYTLLKSKDNGTFFVNGNQCYFI